MLAVMTVGISGWMEGTDGQVGQNTVKKELTPCEGEVYIYKFRGEL